MIDIPTLAVCAADAGSAGPAARLGQALALPLLPAATDPRDCREARALLILDGRQLALRLTGPGAPGAVAVDFGCAAMRHRRGAGRNELLGRAVGVGRKVPLQVIDATAGLGRDSFVLADLGARVLLCERHPVVAAMLASGLEVALSSDDPWLEAAAGRMQLYRGEAAALEAARVAASDVIYLDPMFPPRDKSAAVKKEMALFQFLLQDCADDGEALLCWALDQPVARVVVKRPLKARVLGGRAPSHSIRGKAVRYDVYVLAALG